MNFTIKNTLISVADSYVTTDVQVIDGKITAITPNLEIIGTEINGENKLLLPGFLMPIPILRKCGNEE